MCTYLKVYVLILEVERNPKLLGIFLKVGKKKARERNRRKAKEKVSGTFFNLFGQKEYGAQGLHNISYLLDSCWPNLGRCLLLYSAYPDPLLLSSLYTDHFLQCLVC